jgi:UDP-N-acetylglucosamine acyltransferase
MTASNNFIHPTAVVGPNVTLGSGNYIGPYCVISGRVTIGDDNHFISHVSVGAPPQHRAFKITPESIDDKGLVVIGSRNVFHEFVTIHQPFHDLTSVGSDCFLMAYAHVPHDAVIEDSVTIANSVQIGGHSHLMRGCNIGLSACIHQFTVIGSYAMVGMGSVVGKHILPFNTFAGSGPKRLGVNEVGLKRLGCDADKIERVSQWSVQFLATNEGDLVDEDLAGEVARFKTLTKK